MPLDNRIYRENKTWSGFSGLVLKYLPESYKKVKPIHLITSQYEPLNCDHCGKDLLHALFKEEYRGIIVFVTSFSDGEGEDVDRIKDIYCACKGDCDRTLQSQARKKGCITIWYDISDLVIPLQYLRFVINILNLIRAGEYVYDEDAYKKLRNIIIFLGQKVFRFTTKEERQRVIDLMSFSF